MNKLMKLAMTGVVAFALTAVAGIAEAASEIRVVNSDPTTGEFTLQFDAAQKDLLLYFAKAGEDDNPAVTDTWRNPLFLQDVPAGTTELTVTVPGWTAEGTSRFFLADPEEAIVTRHDYLIGGKDSSGYHNSAFVTGLHPNYDWKYEIVYLVPELKNYQSWIFCHRQDSGNNGSVIALAVRAEEVMRFAYGPGGNNGRDVRTTNKISANVLYQASIDGRTCVYSNLTAGVEFEKVQADIYTTTFGDNHIFAFGCAANGSSFASGDKCSIARVYSFKAWDGSGALKADYRPIVTNNIAGYFDVVSRNFFKAGDGFSNVANTPYVASAETQHVDTLVGHLGEPVAVSPLIVSVFSPVHCVSESLPFADGSEPAYTENVVVGVGESVTFSVPTDEFRWTDPTTHAAYRVRSAGLRIDTYDTTTGEFVAGDPQRELRSYTFTREVKEDGVRVVCLWDAEMLVDAPAGRRANCLRLVSVGTDANGKTVLGEGPFNTGVHPIPAKTRVAFEVGMENDYTDLIAQLNQMPSGTERRFFGVRDLSTDGSSPGIWQRNFQMCRGHDSAKFGLRIDFCNYFEGGNVEGQGYVLPMGVSERFRIDVKPTFVDIVDDKGNAYHAEQKDTKTERSATALNGIIHIFGQHRPHDTVSPVSVDFNGTRYYSFTIWEDGEHLTRDYVPCLDVTNAPAFYDRVTKDYLYPIGSAAVYEAEFDEAAGTNSVQVIGETVDGELAAYFDPDGVQPGYYEIKTGESQTFTATKRKVFDLRVGGYRIDTWVTGTGWVKGTPQTGRSVTLEGDASVRRLVWIWKKANGLVLILAGSKRVRDY